MPSIARLAGSPDPVAISKTKGEAAKAEEKPQKRRTKHSPVPADITELPQADVPPKPAEKDTETK